MASGFEITNLEEFLKSLKEVKKEINKGGVRAVRKACSYVRRDAVRLCPRSPEQKPPKDPTKPVTSRLKSSITYEVLKEGSMIVGLVGPAGPEDKIPYARAQEYGYPPRKLPARPYLRPALIKNEQKIKRLYEEMIMKAIK